MGTRLELQSVLEHIFVEIGHWLWGPIDFEIDDAISAIQTEAHKHVYFQPPASVRMSYPCIVYSLDNVDSTYANNRPYSHNKAYTVMVIDKNPDSEIPDHIIELPMCSFKTKYNQDNLNHFVFRLYF